MSDIPDRCCFNCAFYLEDEASPGKYWSCARSTGSSYRQDMAYDSVMTCEKFKSNDYLNEFRCSRCSDRATYIHFDGRKENGTLICFRCGDWFIEDGSINLFIGDLSSKEIKTLLKKPNVRTILLHGTERRAYKYIKDNGGCLLLRDMPKEFVGALGNLRDKKVVTLGVITKHFIDITEEAHPDKYTFFKVCAIRSDKFQVKES